MQNTNIPTIAIIFGGTGDLTQKKLIPSLFDLYIDNYLPDTFKIVGFARRDQSHEDYQQFVRTILGNHHHDTEKIESFIAKVSYISGNFDAIEDYHSLEGHLKELDDSIGMCTNKLFHLAVPPSYYKNIFTHLKTSGLTEPCSDDTGWTRVLVEKPFGSDTDTARELDHMLGEMFNENQIFRIDHYLAKDALQNILTFRFSNTLFERSWNKDNIEKVHIKLFEDFGVETRGAFYDATGAFKDVGQNHILQMLALIAMDNPLELDAQRLRRERYHTLNSLRVYDTPEEVAANTVRGQYEGFRETENVDPNSNTETYFLVRAQIENQRWQGVPFYLESGKSLSEKKIEITIHFKSANPCMCGSHEDHNHQNILTFQIQPTEGINVQFLFKKPGIEYALDPKQLAFTYDDRLTDGEHIPDAYAKVLHDCIRGDQTAFVSTDEVEAAWRFITPIMNEWKNSAPHVYPKGSDGPTQKEQLLTK